jgi:hypothetical protein
VTVGWTSRTRRVIVGIAEGPDGTGVGAGVFGARGVVGVPGVAGTAEVGRAVGVLADTGALEGPVGVTGLA